MDPDVQAYIEAIDPDHRALFDRLQRLVFEAAPDATTKISYQMPTYVVGKRRLSIGAWKHGLSLYGWREYGDDDFIARHPELKTSKGTIQITPDAAEGIPDSDFLELLQRALAA